MSGIFVTGTDTDVGKTFVSSLICRSLSPKMSTTYFKPIQAGAPFDLDFVREIAGDSCGFLESVYCLKAPMSPNRAADLESVKIDVENIKKKWDQRESSFHIVEGAGGLLVPINENDKIADLARSIGVPAILVASTRLGTINHTLLSIQSMKSMGIDCMGIVLNGPEDPGLGQLLEQQTGLPILFHVPQFSDQSITEIDQWASQDAKFNVFLNKLVDVKNDSAVDGRVDMVEKDRRYVWHPFTQHGIVSEHPLVTKGKGSHLWIEGKPVIDGISSWWVNLFGHCHPELSASIENQLELLEHVVFAGFSHEPAIRLSEKLVHMAAGRGAALEKVFFSDNGSTSVEVALKMAYQYHQLSGQNKKTRFLAFSGSYHGDTLGAMSVGERRGFNEVFTPLMFDVDFVDPFDLAAIEAAFQKNGHEYAAVIVEPMVQGASGMRMYGRGPLDLVARLSKESKTLVICDEVFTGFYRTGRLFAFEHSQLKPDFLCLSKGLTGGYLPLSVTLCADFLYEAFMGNSMKSAFLHGHSYTANPLACAVAGATMDLLETPATFSEIERITQQTSQSLDLLRGRPGILNLRQLGTIGAFEVGEESPNYFKGDMAFRMHRRALEKGVLLRPLGGTLYAVPPYCASNEEILKIYETMGELSQEEF